MMLAPPFFGFHEYPSYRHTPLAHYYNRHIYNTVIDVPDGIKASDIKFYTDEKGKYLHIYGTCENMKTAGEMKTSNTFEKRYTIGSNTDIKHLKANLSHSVLYVSAPKKNIN